MTSPLAGAVKQPKIYAYTFGKMQDAPWEGAREGTGLLKVGMSVRDAAVRIKEQVAPIKVPIEEQHTTLLVESAITNEGKTFTDHDVHKAMERAGYHRRDGEWFEVTPEEVLGAIQALREGSDVAKARPLATFGMRPEQQQAVKQTAEYFNKHTDPEDNAQYLWNAKMRFGKTFTAYQLAKKMGWTRILVLTYKPAVERAWRDDLEGHKDFQGWRFKGKDDDVDADDPAPLVWFASFQDVLGTGEHGAPKEKNEALYLIDWDCVVVDEYHFGAWRDAARSLYLGEKDPAMAGDASEKRALDTPDLDDDFQRKTLEEALPFTARRFLYLSGTPFRALTEGEFLEDQVYNWTYSDEQRAKTEWDENLGPNPYLSLPRKNMLTYEMPDSLREVAINQQAEFSLTEFFRTERDDKDVPVFIHATEVQKWLDLLRGQNLTDLWTNLSTQHRPPLPYEDLGLLQALQHTVWYLPNVDACTAMSNLLTAPHNTFYRDYTVIVAAGSKAGMGEKALGPVEQAMRPIPQDSKTITLSCGKLMTGVTVPPWAGIFMLRELKSPETYFQAAFRVQSPWTGSYIDTEAGGEGQMVFKDQCFVFDFAPNRALSQIVEYAVKLRADLASERDKEAAVEEFMEFLPVLGFDGFGMNQLNAADVINFLTRGISSSMLARRWNSPELLTLDINAMERLLADPELLESLEQIEMFRNITDDLTAMISSNKELQQKKQANDKPTPEEKERQKDAADRRASLRERLRRFVTRIPAFMYLTDDREKTINDIITQIEPGLFQKVTGLTLDDFKKLVEARVFNDSKMNDAVWKFRDFETPSLSYTGEDAASDTVGGFTLTRSDRLSHLIDQGELNAGDTLTLSRDGTGPVIATITDDYGISIGGIRYDSPDAAATAATNQKDLDGWTEWHLGDPDGPTLQSLEARLVNA